MPSQGFSLRVIDEPFILDVMTQLNGVTFENAYAHHQTYDLDGLEIHLIGVALVVGPRIRVSR